MSVTKNVNCCKTYLTKVSIRSLNSDGSNTIVDQQKMQAKNFVLSQWKLIDQLKSYLSKFSSDSTAVENVLNKEFAHFLQKIQPTIYGTDLWKHLSSFTLTSRKHVEKGETETTSIPKVLTSLTLKPKNASEIAKNVAPLWKNSQIAITNESLVSRTRQIIMLIRHAESDQSKLTRIEDLNAHINKYPHAKHIAVKENAIKLLLRIKQKNSNSEVAAALNESLTLLGYISPVLGKGVKILSIDGGGVRGILVLEMLKKLEEVCGKQIHEMFDLICGVSTGAIIATLIGARQHSLEEISEIYRKLSLQIFTQSALRGTSSLVWSHSYYDTALWEKLLREQIGDQTLISTARNSNCPKLCALSAVVNQSRISAYVFRNYTFPCRIQSQYMGGHHHCIWEAVRASAAAPTYFNEFKLGNMLHQDGGVLFNNPTSVALHEAKLLWPETPLQCVLSFGTGRTIPTQLDPNAQLAVANSSWKSKFYAIIDSATDTEGIHTTLSNLLPSDVYFRFNPYLTEVLDIAETDSEKLQQLQRDVTMYLRRNEDKFLEAAEVLNRKKKFIQKTIDWFHLQREIMGL